jgi:hypothetical protein
MENVGCEVDLYASRVMGALFSLSVYYVALMPVDSTTLEPTVSPLRISWAMYLVLASFGDYLQSRRPTYRES